LIKSEADARSHLVSLEQFQRKIDIAARNLFTPHSERGWRSAIYGSIVRVEFGGVICICLGRRVNKEIAPHHPPPPQYLSRLAELVCAGSICPLTTQNADGHAKTFGLVLNVLGLGQLHENSWRTPHMHSE
jgi:hypothetical protein